MFSFAFQFTVILQTVEFCLWLFKMSGFVGNLTDGAVQLVTSLIKLEWEFWLQMYINYLIMVKILGSKYSKHT